MSFKQVGPGLFVNSNKGSVSVEIPHPETCFVVQRKDGKATISGDNKLPIFSDTAKAEAFMDAIKLDPANYTPVEFAWDDLIEHYAPCKYASVTLDNTGEAGFFQSIPFKKAADLQV